MNNSNGGFNLPSRFQENEKVILDLGISGKIKNCTVYAVKFCNGKVKYDILVPIKESSGPLEDSYLTLIENIDSICISD